MSESIFDSFESQISHRMKTECDKHTDPSHDFLHVQRVVKLAKQLALEENADLNVVMPAAYLHDVVIIPKNDPRRTQASRLSADEAVIFLKQIGYPEKYLQSIHHAVASHSFSANIKAESLEAKVVQDADRLDGLGAIGVARCFSLGGVFNRKFYFEGDALAQNRPPDDAIYTLDHFFVKLLKVPSMLQTTAGRKEGEVRLNFLKQFLNQIQSEI